MNEFLASDESGEQKRRSTRITQAVPITVTGVDALGQPFKERTTTVMVNCHGCKYQSKHYVPKNSMVTLEVPRGVPGLPPRSAQGRVIWVQRPRTVRELFQIGLEFEVAGNIWGIAFPPEDWFPHPDDVGPEVIPEPSARDMALAPPETVASQAAPGNVSTEATSPQATPEFPSPAASTAAPSTPSFAPPVAPPTAPPTAQTTSPASSTEPAPPVMPTPPPAAPAMPESKIHVMPSPPQAPPTPAGAVPAPPPSPQTVPGVTAQEAQLVVARHVAKAVTEAKETLDKTARRTAQAAVNEEMTVVRQQMDAQLHEAVERAIKVSMERVSESAVKKVVQQAAERTTAIVEEARKATGADAERMDAKVRQAVEAAVAGAAEQAARQAAEQATSQNLKEAVEQVVERVIAEREATSPSLAILSSPEAAQAQLDQWKRNLEDIAQGTHNQTLERTQAEIAVANQRWQHDFDEALTGASASIQQKMNEASQAALAQSEHDFAARSLDLRATLDEALAEARNSASAVTAETQNAAATARADAQNILSTVAAQTQSAVDALKAEFEQERVRTEAAQNQLEQSRLAAIAQAEQEFEARSVELRAALDQALAGAQNSVQAVTAEANSTIQSLTTGLEQERARTEAAQQTLRDSSNATVDMARQQLDAMLAAQQAEMARRADEVISERTQHIEPVLQNSAQKVLEHFAAELDRTLTPQLSETQNAITALDNATQRAAEVRSTIEEQVREASERTVQQSLEHLRQEAAKVPTELEESVRLTLQKAEQDLEQKVSETQHETYEALLKASDWYQKKTHTTMQAALEKSVDQSTSTLRDRAAEISSLAASDLDHQRRAYVNHAQGQMEESAKEVVDRERGRLIENSEIASAGFANRVNQLTADSFKRFEESSRSALEKARSDMEFAREGSFAEYQSKLDEQLVKGIEQARTQLQSQLVPLMEEWDAERESEKRLWMEQLKKNTDESIEQYKGRLENASNSWLLASAATLGQNSQAMLDTLAKAAEKRIRETCADVLAGMGDTLKERLIGISTGFTPTDDPDAPPPPKKKP